MRKLCFIISLLTAINCFGQADSITRANSLLNWLIKEHHIKLLCRKTDLSTFYGMGSDILVIHTAFVNDPNASSHKCLKDFMADDEAKTFYSKVKTLAQTRWDKTGYTLPTKYFKFYNEPDFGDDSDDKGKTFIGLTVPVFLNDSCTRVLIGEYFTADVAFGRGDVLLCEYEDGSWKIVARVVTWNS